MIQEILEKHMDDFTGTILFESFPALAANIEALIEERCVKFAEWVMSDQFVLINKLWVSYDSHYSGCTYTTSELYQLFINKTQSNAGNTNT